ncbi:DgyrCDS6517 [Dimorphilus gyrociliatus]|uniref:DgyrCDS6517 n=1 Tax=Dimorphilus gyrociliatus TaxID=2664684 RepID=A0A7I8VNA9_9ANNE|nr:DgyrCDS6517 [Dimorphilus gyrociliatus]
MMIHGDAKEYSTFNKDSNKKLLKVDLCKKVELGKSARRGYSNLPDSDFTYGIKNNKRDGGAVAALNWLSQRNIENSHHFKQLSMLREKDYHRLNVMALKAGITDVRGQTLFRSSNDYRLPVNKRKKTIVKFEPKPEIPDIVFGIPVRPSTPIKEVISHQFQDEWIKERSRERERRIQAIKEAKENMLNIKETKTTILRKTERETPKGLWKIKKFERNAKSYLDTFRSKEARMLAFPQHLKEKSITEQLPQRCITSSASDTSRCV